MNTRPKHTPGPWRWEFSEKAKHLQLCGGNPKFDLTVMDFVRYGTGGAAPRFREDVDHMNIMERVDKLAQPVEGREHHKSWFQDIDHPDARLISAAPELLEALEKLYALVENEHISNSAWDLTFAADAIAKAKGEQP